MRTNSGEPAIGWLELTASSKWRGAIASVHPINLDEHQLCYGVTVEQHWLCDSDGALTIFESMSAATRFLHLLNMDRIGKGGSRDRNELGHAAFQCFQLTARGLKACNKCRVGNRVCAQGHCEYADLNTYG